jgi:putative transposase
MRSSAEIDRVFQRNIQFLEDYFRSDSREVSSASRDVALGYVAATPGLSLEDLLQATKNTVTPDEIFAMIAADVLYVDWRAAPLAEPMRVGVAYSEACRSAFRSDVDHHSEVMPIGIPNGSRSVLQL